MATRYRWPKQVGNDGLARVSVPEAALRANTLTKVSVPNTTPEAVAALEAVIGALREEVRDTRERAERADRVAGVLRAKLAAARYAGEIVRAEVGNLRRRLDTATEQLGEALQQVRLLTDQRAAPLSPGRRSWLPWRRS
jgi:chromosome segregation ATPase